jgi:hypothetical protein
MVPKFEFVPIVPESPSGSGADVAGLVLEGISTKADSPDTDRGRLYGRIVDDGEAGYFVQLFADFERSAAAIVEGRIAKNLVPGVVVLAPHQAGDRPLAGRLRLVEVRALPASFVAVVSFAIDPDVVANATEIERFPGYDDAFGLAYFHAAAMKQILGSELVAAAPHLYAGKVVSAFLAPTNNSLPDVSKVVNPEALRQAQADLVRFLSAKQKNYLEEWQEIAAAASEDFQRDMATIAGANKPADDDVAETSPGGGISFGSFTRG